MLNISSQIYVGYDTSSAYDLPEADLIPAGETSAERKKLEKLSATKATVRELDNVPLPGFTLYKVNKKSWGAAEPTWLVIDPRGFLVRITLSNLDTLMMVSGITEGLIQERCVWARQNNNTHLELISINSDDYKAAVENTVLLEEKVNIKDVSIGDTVQLQDNIIGTYMGVLSFYGPLMYETFGVDRYVPQTYLRRQVVRLQNGKYFHKSDTKILKILQKSPVPLTREDSVNEIREKLAAGTCSFTLYPESTISYNTLIGSISFVSTYAERHPSITIEEISREDAFALYAEMVPLKDSCKLLLQDSRGKNYVVDFPYNFSSNVSGSRRSKGIDTRTVINFDTRSLTIDRSGLDFYGNSPVLSNTTLDSFVKYFKIVKHVKNETYI